MNGNDCLNILWFIVLILKKGEPSRRDQDAETNAYQKNYINKSVFFLYGSDVVCLWKGS